MRAALRWMVMTVMAGFGLTLTWAILELPLPILQLAPDVARHIDVSGVTHPVTAVLLNFRGYDTFLEIAVLLTAMLSVLATGAGEPLTGIRINGSPPPILQATAAVTMPLMILVAGYLLWAGAERAGGAFQAAAVLGAVGVLLYLAGFISDWGEPGALLRAAIIAGFLFFLSVAALPLFSSGALLQYPPQHAKGLIFAIEAGLTLSLALILAGLFLWLPNESEEAEPE